MDAADGTNAVVGRKRLANKICRVCGDNAINVNFNVVTCESCKPFFRRNANKVDTVGCKFEGKCEITVETRRLCKDCRLKKCFEVGMKREWITTEEKKAEKRKIIEENCMKRNKENSLSVEANGEFGYDLEDDSVHTIQNSSLTHQSDSRIEPITPTQSSSISLKQGSTSTSFKKLILTQLQQTSSDMVTIPKQVLTQLLQENSKTPCTCTCSCGRYPKGSFIVDEVKKEWEIREKRKVKD